ncbi:hypothetical protein ACSYAY_10760 [Leptospirillum ferriphilum]|uniref:hypothetical protein n=1 Tax=Leptospirillum ferriphilum TaxID=178606 RepID=UPI003EE6F4E4
MNVDPQPQVGQVSSGNLLEKRRGKILRHPPAIAFLRGRWPRSAQGDPFARFSERSGLLRRSRTSRKSVTAFTDILFRLSENVSMEDLKMEKTTAGYRAFATRIVTRGTFTAEHAAHPRIKHTVERALLLTVVAVAFFLLAHH